MKFYERAKYLIWTVILATVFGLGGIVLPAVYAQQGEPQPGTVQGITTYTYYPATAIITDGTYYSSAPIRQSGQDITLTRNWNAMDVFATVDITGTASVTVTPQFSPDQSTWADAEYLVQTWDSTGTLTTNVVKHQIVMSADGTEAIRLPLMGDYTRFKIEITGDLTPTVWATLRNN